MNKILESLNLKREDVEQKDHNIKRFGEWGFDYSNFFDGRASEIKKIVEHTAGNYEEGKQDIINLIFYGKRKE